MKRILILAAGALEAEALRRALRYMPESVVIGYAEITRPCEWPVREGRPDVVVVNDGVMSDNTLERVKEVRRCAPEATIICRSSHSDPERLRQLIAAGADATLDMALELSRMVVLVREIAAGTVFRVRLPEPAPPEAQCNLTARELEILRMMAAGATNSAVAANLWVTEQTVKFHLSNVYRKLGVANRTEASHYAHTHGLIKPTEAPGDVAPATTTPVAA
jgi:DNA-binding NarL/FixJ family response regulator